MSQHDPRRIAIDSLFLTLADRLPAELAARDALRNATRRTRLGPYTIPAASTLTINGEAFPLTAGSRTAAQIVAEIAPSAVSFVATEETDNGGARLLFVAATAPAREIPSVLRFEGDEATLAALGLRAGTSDVAEDAVADPEPMLSEAEPGDIVQIDRTLIYCADSVVAPYVAGSVRRRMHQVRVQLEAWIPGSPSLPISCTLAKALETERAIAACLRTGDSRAPFFVGGTTAGARVVQAKPADLQTRTQVFQFRAGGTTIPVAVSRPVIDFLISSSET